MSGKPKGAVYLTAIPTYYKFTTWAGLVMVWDLLIDAALRRWNDGKSKDKIEIFIIN